MVIRRFRASRAHLTGTRVSFREGDVVVFKNDLKRRRRVQRWRVLAFNYIYGEGVLVDIAALQGDMQATVHASELTPVPEKPQREPCVVSPERPAARQVAFWEVTHPRFGQVLALRAPYNEGFMTQFRQLIRNEDRFWDPRYRLWYVLPQHRLLVGALLRQYFPNETPPED